MNEDFKNGATEFKKMMIEATNPIMHPHIEGVFSVFHERYKLKNISAACPECGRTDGVDIVCPDCC